MFEFRYCERSDTSGFLCLGQVWHFGNLYISNPRKTLRGIFNEVSPTAIVKWKVDDCVG